MQADPLIGYVKTYIILPTTVYGISTGKLVKAGIANAHSIQIPLLMKIGLDRGQGGVVGEGKNTWPHVEIHERQYHQIDIAFRHYLGRVFL